MLPPLPIPPDRPVLIAGPTASGKSALAAEIVGRDGGVVVNADALQVYDCWRILSARPSVAEEAALPHRLYGHVPRRGIYSAGHWLKEVEAVLREGLRPVIVGGTGLYFSSLTNGLADIPHTPPEMRHEADAFLARAGLSAMVADLDPATAGRIDLRNPARVQRAWEVLRATGRGLADWQAATGAPLLPLAETVALVLRPDRDWLAERIDRRFDLMIEAGALEEARVALADWDPALPSSRAIGAPELVAHLKGERTLDEAIAAAKLASRQYAKRQRTWFRNRMRDWREIRLP
uniref:tRNA dimethylallyltransferase n=1 Tax=Cereibacter sphaeroides (strain ATCC 17025 / ATH 2.4.3) TaxID=349102 RepID=MIAA_CERS5|nr:RecName: Full=tRNA dimethylallyltransferase; AltName: Full=Dimethylallyl diphosphate:tRNA dimethylallyltransferase; Short=DMAPP:tRNA dimethylallyltransferase; Short=DMATase; AltName: Full=Isopentenyl-diphosphate:tRNA isopentenyltransferase; Short=IPP transferase; Short=IPPT; Short=IPTase [Cereibacter sphaeroides ATCC 17025]